MDEPDSFSGRENLARSKKEVKKPTFEERMNDRWAQQVFFIRKNYPSSIRQIQAIEKAFEKKSDSFPNEEALNELTNLYIELKATSPSQSM
jgi:hypothetical protein